jgi:uncharacterized DUF497 family protein
MELEWDEAKRQNTLHERQLDFAAVVDFDFATANTVEDNRATMARFVRCRRGISMVGFACSAGPNADSGRV